MNEPQQNRQPWKLEFNFAPKILPEEMRRFLGDYYATGKPSLKGEHPKWRPPPSMTSAHVLECAQKAQEALKALFEQAFWNGDRVAAWCFAGKLFVAVDNLTTLVKRDARLVADFAPRMPKFPLNCGRSARTSNENKELLERRLMDLPELVTSKVTHKMARDWFDVAWSVLNRQTGNRPETLPPLRATWTRICKARDKEQEKYFRRRHPQIIPKNRNPSNPSGTRR